MKKWLPWVLAFCLALTAACAAAEITDVREITPEIDGMGFPAYTPIEKMEADVELSAADANTVVLTYPASTEQFPEGITVEVGSAYADAMTEATFTQADGQGTARFVFADAAPGAEAFVAVGGRQVDGAVLYESYSLADLRPVSGEYACQPLYGESGARRYSWSLSDGKATRTYRYVSNADGSGFSADYDENGALTLYQIITPGEEGTASATYTRQGILVSYVLVRDDGSTLRWGAGYGWFTVEINEQNQPIPVPDEGRPELIANIMFGPVSF